MIIIKKSMKKENTHYKSIINQDLSIEQKIDKQCKEIHYGKKSYEKLKNNKNTINNKQLDDLLTKIRELYLKDDGKEGNMLKLFLPKECWNKDNTINFEKIKKLIISGNTDYIQYIFGTRVDKEWTEIFTNILYKHGSMQHSSDHRTVCHPLVDWTILFNMLYTKCSTYNNDVECFARFILPVLSEEIKESEINPYNDTKIIPNKTMDTRKIYNFYPDKQLLDLFNNNPVNNISTTNFIGIISIKFFYELHNMNEYRIWYIYIFKNNDFKISSRRNILTGIREEYFSVSQTLNYINKGGLYNRDAITYYELLFFEKLANEGNIYIYTPSNNPHLLFLSLKDNLEDNLFLKTLEMKKVENDNITIYKKKKIYIIRI